MTRSITTHTADLETPEQIHCLDEGGLYAIEIHRPTGKTFGQRLYEWFNVGDQNAFAFSRLNIEKRTRWETAAQEMLKHTMLNPVLCLSHDQNTGISPEALVAVARDFLVIHGQSSDGDPHPVVATLTEAINEINFT